MAADREALLNKHVEEVNDGTVKKKKIKRSSLQEKEAQLLQGCNLLNKDDIGFLLLLKNKKVTFAYLQSFISMYCVCFFGAFLSVWFNTYYGVPEEDMGYCFLLASVPYLLSCIIFPIILKKMPRKLQAVICFFVSGIALSLIHI